MIEVAVLVHVEHAREQIGVGAVADRDEQPGDGQRRGRAVDRRRDLDALDRVVAEDVGDRVVPQELDLGVGEGAVLHDLARPQLVAAVDERDLVGELGEERRLLDRRVATADDGDVVAAEEEAVAGRARRQAVTEQLRLGLEAEHQRLRAGRHDDGVGDGTRVSCTQTRNGRSEKSTRVTFSVRNSAPKRSRLGAEARASAPAP